MTSRPFPPALVLALAFALACVSLPSVEAVQSFTLDDEWRLGAQLAPEIERR